MLLFVWRPLHSPVSFLHLFLISLCILLCMSVCGWILLCLACFTFSVCFCQKQNLIISIANASLPRAHFSYMILFHFLLLILSIRKQMYYFDLVHVAVFQLLFIYLFILCFILCFPTLISWFDIIFIYFEQQNFNSNTIMMYTNDWDWVLNRLNATTVVKKQEIV